MHRANEVEDCGVLLDFSKAAYIDKPALLTGCHGLTSAIQAFTGNVVPWCSFGCKSVQTIPHIAMWVIETVSTGSEAE